MLVNKGLKGEFNSSFARLMMYNHGYAEKQEAKHDVADPVQELFKQVAEKRRLLVPYERSEPEE